jgi:hypothetical protein
MRPQMSNKTLHPLPSSPGQATAPQPQFWREAGREPSLREALADPLVHLVMRRDGVSLAELEAVVAHAQARLGRELCCCGSA